MQVVTKDQRSVHTTEYPLVEQAWITTESIKNVSTAAMGRIDRFGMQ